MVFFSTLTDDLTYVECEMSRLLLLGIVLATTCTPVGARDSRQVKESLAFSCLGRSFVSVAVMTPERDGFPAVQLMLTDPSGRTAGEGPGERIPDSSWGEIVQLPEHPQRSRARAVEVCNAEQGIYQVKVRELGSGPYLLVASASGDADNDSSAVLHHIGRKGRIRLYRFKFTVKDRQLNLRWLDSEGREQALIETPEW
jgi:hypothetical protein